MQLLPRFIFMSRWLQVPLYLGLIVAQLVYVWQFWVELIHLVSAMMGNENALEIIRQSVAVPGADPAVPPGSSGHGAALHLGGSESRSGRSSRARSAAPGAAPRCGRRC